MASARSKRWGWLVLSCRHRKTASRSSTAAQHQHNSCSEKQPQFVAEARAFTQPCLSITKDAESSSTRCTKEHCLEGLLREQEASAAKCRAEEAYEMARTQQEADRAQAGIRTATVALKAARAIPEPQPPDLEPLDKDAFYFQVAEQSLLSPVRLSFSRASGNGQWPARCLCTA